MKNLQIDNCCAKMCALNRFFHIPNTYMYYGACCVRNRDSFSKNKYLLRKYPTIKKKRIPISPLMSLYLSWKWLYDLIIHLLLLNKGSITWTSVFCMFSTYNLSSLFFSKVRGGEWFLVWGYNHAENYHNPLPNPSGQTSRYL